MSESITFNIKHENDKIKAIELDQQSRIKLNQKDQVRFEDLGTSLINGVSEGVMIMNVFDKRPFKFEDFETSESLKIKISLVSVKT